MALIPASLPIAAGPQARPVLQQRWQHTRRSLVTAFGWLPGAGLVLTVLVSVFAVLDRGSVPWWTPLPLLAAAAPWVILLRSLHRGRLLHQPNRWGTAALGLGTVQGLLGVSAAAVPLYDQLPAAFALLVLGIPIGCAALGWQAERRLLRPLIPELGDSALPLSVPLRTRPAGSVEIGHTDVQWIVAGRTGALGRYESAAESTPLSAIREARPTTIEDQRWQLLSGGSPADTPAGPALLVRTTIDSFVLPVDHPELLADLLRGRQRFARFVHQ